MLDRARTLSDTIVACATPPGQGAIAVVRVSGTRSREILGRLAPKRRSARPNELRLARLLDSNGAILDHAMVVEMIQPNSYTGDDVVELHLHGSIAVVDSVVARITSFGARIAEPGEFTLRAFVNGRMTLAEAEGIADLIASCNETQRRVAARHMAGELADLVGDVLHRLEGILAETTAACDFPDDVEMDGLGPSHFAELQSIHGTLVSILGNARVGLQGVRRVVLCGAPNVGKSTLANALVGGNRVLVDATPGTTRDPVEIQIENGNGHWLLVDTAGLRPKAKGLEARGMKLTLEQIQRSDIVIWMIDPTNPVWPQPDLEPDALVGSKADLADFETRLALLEEADRRGLAIKGWLSGVEVSSREGLRKEFADLFSSAPSMDEIVVVRRRHVEAFEAARDAIERAEVAAKSGYPLDIVTMEIEGAALALGRVLGRNVDEAVWERIFSSFCLGK